MQRRDATWAPYRVCGMQCRSTAFLKFGFICITSWKRMRQTLLKIEVFRLVYIYRNRILASCLFEAFELCFCCIQTDCSIHFSQLSREVLIIFWWYVFYRVSDQLYDAALYNHIFEYEFCSFFQSGYSIHTAEKDIFSPFASYSRMTYTAQLFVSISFRIFTYIQSTKRNGSFTNSVNSLIYRWFAICYGLKKTPIRELFQKHSNCLLWPMSEIANSIGYSFDPFRNYVKICDMHARLFQKLFYLR